MSKNYKETILQGNKEFDHYFVVSLNQSIKYGENGTLAADFKKKYQYQIEENDLREAEKDAT